MTRLRVLAGVQGGGFNGIDAYAEQVAVTAAQAGHDVTLVATTPNTAEALRARLDPKIAIFDLGLPEPTAFTAFADRVSSRVAMSRIESELVPVLEQRGEKFDIAHLNRPPLADAVRPFAKCVVVAAWFYPHEAFGRVAETWNHARGFLPRRAALTAKSVSYFLGDERGYRAADVVLAPTDVLARQLRAQGYEAAVCPPPVRLQRGKPIEHTDDGRRRLLAVSGDLSHPRKNLELAVDAVRRLAERGGNLKLTFIGRHEKRLRERAVTLGANVEVEFTGALEPAEVHARMSAADAFLFPSLYEEWGYAAVESMLAGTPVVTLPVYPFEWMLAGGLGVISNDDAASSYADAIARALDGACLARRELAAEAAKRYGAPSIAERLTKIYVSKLLPLSASSNDY
jgi:glycosyltransferase involved in cell wall biosynthesis